jgi:hypothetical protein
MAFRREKLSYTLTVEGATMTAVESVAGGLIQLRFDDPFKSKLILDGPFILRSDGHDETYSRLDYPWIQDVLATLLYVRIMEARFNRYGRIRRRLDPLLTLSNQSAHVLAAVVPNL